MSTDRRRRWGRRSAIAAAFLLLGCQVELRDDSVEPVRVDRERDLLSPKPGVPPLPTTPEQLDGELRALIPRLESATPGGACRRLEALSLYLADPRVVQAIGTEPAEKIPVVMAEGQCVSGRPGEAAAVLREHFQFREPVVD